MTVICVIVVTVLVLIAAALLYLIYSHHRANIMYTIKEMLIKTLTILNKHDIKYWAAGGTLLGLFREGDLISTDNDADLSIKQADLDPLLDPRIQAELNAVGLIMVESINRTYKIYRISDVPEPARNKHSYYCPQCPNIDIFVWDYANNECLIRDCTKQWSGMTCWTGIRRDDTPAHLNETFTIKYYPSLGLNVRIPAKTREFIEFRYGPDWRSPKPGYKGPFNGCKGSCIKERSSFKI